MLDDNRLTDAFGAALAPHLSACIALRHLSMADNQLGGAAATALGGAVRPLQHLHHVDLRKNKLDALAIAALRRGLATRCGIDVQSLLLEGNVAPRSECLAALSPQLRGALDVWPTEGSAGVRSWR